MQQFIVDDLDGLVDDWADFARTLPALEGRRIDELRDHAASMLQAIAADIGSHQSGPEQLAKSRGLAPRLLAADTGAEVHGSDRFTQGLGVNELVAEFRALRATVLRRWTAARGPASVGMLEQLMRFNEGIDQAIAESLARFLAEVRRSDEEERRRAELEADRLREQEARARRAEGRLDTALVEAHIAYWEWDPRADRVTVSRTMHDLYGLRPSERFETLRHGFALLHAEDRSRYQALVTQAAQDCTGWQCEFRIVRPRDAEVAWLEERAMPIADAADGGRIFITGLVWDITERKHAEQVIRRNEQTFANLIEHAPFGIYAVDAHLRVTHMNRGSREGAFRNVRTVIGSDLGDVMRVLWPQAVASEVVSAFRHTLDTGEPYLSSRFVNPRADVQATESYEWELHPIVLPDGQRGVVCYYFDSTRLRNAEEELREADRRKDQFLATLAHELRNPIAPIRQAAAIARSGEAPPEKVRWSVEVIDRQAGKMALLLDDLLDVSRITRGRLELQRRTVDLADVVQSAIETVSPQVEARQQEVHVELAEPPVMLNADPLRLSQVIANLLANASRYSAPGSAIRLTVCRQAEFVELVVSDPGIGIAADRLDAVFEMFAQGAAPKASQDSGLGVGLALARRLVELHGGTLVAHSEGLGRGSRFVARLPLAVPAAGHADAAVDPAEEAALESERILVIDDNEDAADSLAQLLRLEGHEVRAEYGGEAGLAAAAAFKPTLVLLDLGMPGIDGYEVARRLRRMEGGTAVTLVAVSGWGQAADRARTAAAGFDHHLTKPLDEGQLRPALARARQRRNTAR